MLGLILVLSSCQGPPAALHEQEQVEVRDLRFFLRRLHQLDHLPQLESAHTAMISTWDRAGGIRDGWCFDGIEGNRNVLLEVDGPGCIHRIFTGHLGPILDHTRIQIFLDHSGSDPW
jgi:hypothetical protein